MCLLVKMNLAQVFDSMARSFMLEVQRWLPMAMYQLDLYAPFHGEHEDPSQWSAPGRTFAMDEGCGRATPCR
jgi:hypothetical protein